MGSKMIIRRFEGEILNTFLAALGHFGGLARSLDVQGRFGPPAIAFIR